MRRASIETPATAAQRRIARVRGRVQGVGFRPFVHRAAVTLGLSGAVWNEAGDVVVDVEGDGSAIGELVRRIARSAPPHARVESVEVEPAEPSGRAGFAVRASAPSVPPELADPDGRVPRVAPDAAACPACVAEVRDPADRRHGHAFASCTDCGPRYAIARALPFDRERTSMALFEPCAACACEHDDPGSRRFHSQTNACPACGPRLRVEPCGGGDRRTLDPFDGGDPLGCAARVLAGGGIVALKGPGGFQLACDARSAAAVARLRARKRRPEKPLAVMLADVEAVAREAEVGPLEREALLSSRAPIVLLARRATSTLAPGIAPGLRDVGCMLPSTPLHHLLLARVEGTPLVMTSGNASGEPLCASDDEARTALGDVADVLLLHDREIVNRVDDSVVRVIRGRVRVLRRARGFVPEVLALPRPAPPLLAIGSDLKCAPCLARGRDAVLGPHLGDLAQRGVRRFHAEARAGLGALLGIRPRVVAHDLHPDYHGTHLARATGLPAIEVQHHHAHVAACLAEHGRAGPAIGVAWDGAGFGTDGTVWGGEVLLADLETARRMARIRPVALPGGDAAAREPWRMALAHLVAAGIEDERLEVERVGAPAAARALVREMIAKGVHAPSTTSAGRLFDAVAALAGLRARATFEGQAAAELEAHAQAGAEPYPLPLGCSNGLLELDPRPLVRAVAGDARRGVGAVEIGSRFHAAVASALGAACRAVRARTAVGTVVLTGGCFQNALLSELAADELERSGFEVLLHERVPPGDGGLALGQAAVAAARL